MYGLSRTTSIFKIGRASCREIPQEKSENPTDVYNTIMSDPRFSNTELNVYYIYYTIERGNPVFQGMWFNLEAKDTAYAITYAVGDKQASVESGRSLSGSLDPIQYVEPNFMELKSKIEKELDTSFKNDEGKCLVIGRYKGYTIDESVKFWSISLYDDFNSAFFGPQGDVQYAEIMVEHY